MGCWGRKRGRLLCMLMLTFMFMVLEVVVSRVTASLAMLSDSFHMLSDVLALVVALVAERFARRTHATQKNTFGWIRAEVMGALVNAIFLTGLCFAILLEAIERFIEPHEMQQPLVVLGVGVAGLLVNVLGLCLFHHHSGFGHDSGHGHSHGGHGHGLPKGTRGKGHRAGGSDGSAAPGEQGPEQEETNTLVANSSNSNGLKADPADPEKSRNEDAVDVQVNGNLIREPEHVKLEEDDSAGQLNMRGVFLHVLGDALGSVIVVVNALVFYFSWKGCSEREFCVNPCTLDPCKAFVEIINSTQASVHEAGPCWVLYLDPTLCIVMVCILLYTTYPLLKESALILLQTVPKQIDITNLIKELRAVEGVEEVHELHVWQLAGSRIIATAHIKCEDPTSYMQVAKTIKDVFHNHGIHATTIQPEFASVGSKSSVVPCELACRTQCALKQCCGTRPLAHSGKDAEKAPTVSISCLELSDHLEKKPKRTKGENIPAVVIEIKKMPNKQPESSL
ncbi:proton-coupled zinc antiporter SLC30A1 isoform X2 [Ochotona princeps]|uniref:proton-coupled zinc antiporter SLC30A1 isoform X2 n=1 Tax=Ochotona princeps TaxID=9978 RepID=UPI00032B2149|nr:proton-coupled zinc antiporter SLC30A1 isoform X2 [Ochotona princeps]